MTISDLPLVVEPTELAPRLDDKELLILDLSKPETHAQAHLPGAVSFNYIHLVRADKPAMGLVPDTESLVAAMRNAGVAENRHIVAYDDEGGGKACRLLWTLDLLGHPSTSLLNGGLHAWHQEQLTLTNEITTPSTSTFNANLDNNPIAEKGYILDNLGNDQVQLLDSRTPEEYNGTNLRAHRGGHIPGAINFNWVDAIDDKNAMRMKPVKALEKLLLDELGLDRSKEVIAYCQTHHRSSYNYIVLKRLGFDLAKGYPGSWSEWGNDANLPIEV